MSHDTQHDAEPVTAHGSGPHALVPPRPVVTLDLAVEGMTCASCVARVEKRLNGVPGASATVNLALESAHVELTVPDDASDLAAEEELLAAVRRAGYDARVTARRGGTSRDRAAGLDASDRSAAHRGHDGGATGGVDLEMALSGHSMAHGHGHAMDDDADLSAPTPDRGADLRRRLRVSAALTVPVLVLSMIPGLQVDGWQWIVAALALPVATWAAWPFHRAAARAARHGASTMDTLVSIGIVAATAWSLWALVLGGAGRIGMRMEPTLWPRADAHAAMAVPELYFEVAAVVTTFLLAGRYAEHRSRRRAGDALRALLDLGAKDATLLETDPAGRRVERSVPAAALRVGDLVARPAGREGARPTASWSRAPARSTRPWSPASRCRSTSAPGRRSPARP